MEFNNETIRTAVQLYLKNETEGKEKYGHINTWNVSNVTNMRCMFCNAGLFNQPLDKWNVSNVTNMSWMFYDASSFNQPLNIWNVSNVTHIFGMFNSITIGQMLKKHNLTTKNYFDKNVYHELFVWPRKKDYVTFLVNNQYLPLNKHQEKHEYHPLFDNTDMSKYIACYL